MILTRKGYFIAINEYFYKENTEPFPLQGSAEGTESHK